MRFTQKGGSPMSSNKFFLFKKVYERFRSYAQCSFRFFCYLDLLLRDGVILGKNVKVSGMITINNYGGLIVIGDNVTFDKDVTLQCFGGKIIIGNYVHIGRFCFLNSVSSITIGDYSLLAPFCHLTDRNHGINKKFLIRDQKGVVNPIRIGRDVWLGSRCVVLQGVTIGDGSVIGAGSVVNRNIPPYSIAVGVPAVVKKRRL